MFVGAHAPGLCWPVFSNPLDDEVQVYTLLPSSRWFTDRDRLWGREEPGTGPLSDSLTQHIIDSGLTTGLDVSCGS